MKEPAHLQGITEGRLLLTLGDGRFHAGTRLGEQMGLSRAGIGRAVSRLRAYGLPVNACRGRGYQVPGGYEVLRPQRLIEAWSRVEEGPGEAVQVQYRPASTNDTAFTIPLSMGAVFAEGQSAGRGRIGRRWISSLGGIYFSVFHELNELMEPPTPLALAVANRLAHELRDCGILVQVKWPNDVLLGGRKVAGILSELRGDPAGRCRIVIGVGVNVSAPRPKEHEHGRIMLDSNAGSARQRNELAGRLAAGVSQAVARFSTQGAAACLQGWEAVDALCGQSVVLRQGDRVYRGYAKGVDGQGRLWVEGRNGVVAFASGEAQLLGAGRG